MAFPEEQPRFHPRDRLTLGNTQGGIFYPPLPYSPMHRLSTRFTVFSLALLFLLGIIVMADDCGCGLPDFYDPFTPDSGPATGPSDSGGSSGGTSGPSSGGGSSGGPSGGSGSGGTGSGGSDSQPAGSSGASAEASLLEARSLFQKGMYNESLAAYNRTVAADPASFTAWIGKGTTETVLGMYESALASFARAAKIKPDDPDPWVNRGEVLLAAGDPAGATAAFDRALVIHPGLAAALNGKERAHALELHLSSPTPEETPIPEETPVTQPETPVPGNTTYAETSEQGPQKSPLATASLALAFLVPAVLASRRRG